MNYEKLYGGIIENAKSRVIDGYSERHHVVPKSLGGSDSSENLVRLTAREHFVCHYLLTKMYEEDTTEWYKMVNAFLMMKCSMYKHQRYFNSRLYESLKTEFSKVQSRKQAGEKNSQFGRIWVYNDEIQKSKKISKNEKDVWLAAGWKEGRVIDFSIDKTKRCKKCGSEKCERPEVCSKNICYTMIECFGFDNSMLGNDRFYGEFDRVSKKLHDEYHVDMMSTIELSKKYGISTQRIDYVFKVLGIKVRSYKEALRSFVSKQ